LESLDCQSKCGSQLGMFSPLSGPWWEVLNDGSHLRISRSRHSKLKARKGNVKEHTAGEWPANISIQTNHFKPTQSGPTAPAGQDNHWKPEGSGRGRSQNQDSMDLGGYMPDNTRPRSPVYNPSRKPFKRPAQEMTSLEHKARDTKTTPDKQRFFSPPRSGGEMPSIGSVMDTGSEPIRSPSTVPVLESAEKELPNAPKSGSVKPTPPASQPNTLSTVFVIFESGIQDD